MTGAQQFTEERVTLQRKNRVHSASTPEQVKPSMQHVSNRFGTLQGEEEEEEGATQGPSSVLLQLGGSVVRTARASMGGRRVEALSRSHASREIVSENPANMDKRNKSDKKTYEQSNI